MTSGEAREMENLGKRLAISTGKYALAQTTHASKFNIQTFPNSTHTKPLQTGKCPMGRDVSKPHYSSQDGLSSHAMAGDCRGKRLKDDRNKMGGRSENDRRTIGEHQEDVTRTEGVRE